MTDSVSANAENNTKQSDCLKIIVLGDSAVGKSKLLERFLVNNYVASRYSTYAVNIFKHTTKIDGKAVDVEFWDTAGQEKFDNIHHSYFHQAHACIMIFDATRKITYKNLDRWYTELRDIRPHIPCLCAVNKIDTAMEVTKKSFSFPKKHDMPLYFVSAANGTNVVRLFRDAIRLACAYRSGDTADFIDQILRELEDEQIYDDVSQTVDYDETYRSDLTDSSDGSSNQMLSRSSSLSTTCFRLPCFSNQSPAKHYKFYIQLLQSEEWNYLHLLKTKFQPHDEQEKHLKRLQSTSKFSSLLFVYYNSLTAQKLFSSLHRTLCCNHYERLHSLFQSLCEILRNEQEKELCSNILERLNYLINQMKIHDYESSFIQFPSYATRTLCLLWKDQYQFLRIMSKDKQTCIERIPLHLILGLNIPEDKHVLVFSVEQPQGSNTINNYHFAHADRTILSQWYQLLDRHIKQAKCDHMHKYQEFRI